MEGDESRLTFESPNLFGSKEGGPRERERETFETRKMDGRMKGRRTRRDFAFEFHRKEATERVTRSSTETGFFNLAFHFQIPGIPESRDTDRYFSIVEHFQRLKGGEKIERTSII